MTRFFCSDFGNLGKRLHPLFPYATMTKSQTNTSKGGPPMYTDELIDFTEENLREIEAVEDYENV